MPGIEPYLCVDGIEVANACRVNAYARALGFPCMQSPPAPGEGCCCCGDTGTGVGDSCEIRVDAGFEGGEAAMCMGIYALGPGTTWQVEIRAYWWEVCPGGPGRPALPIDTDPGWVIGTPPGGIPAETEDLIANINDGTGDCRTWAEWSLGLEPPAGGAASATACGYYEYKLTHPGGGSVTLLFYVHPAQFAGDDLGDSGVSFDGGATWQVRGVETAATDCVATSLLVGVGTVPYNLSDPDQFTDGITVGWGVGPFTLTIRDYPAAGGPGIVPSAGDPGWITAATGSYPLGLASLGRARDDGDLPAAGEYVEYTALDQTTGTTIRFVWWFDYANFDLSLGVNPSTFAGSVFTEDGGATWVPWRQLYEYVAVEGVPGSGSGNGWDCGPFTTPEGDDAPWYDPAVAASADVLGVFLEEARISAPLTRERRDAPRGSSLGPQSLPGREVFLTGWLYARTGAAAAYGRQWLAEALAGPDCDGCGLPDALISTSCGQGEDNGMRTLRRVGLTSFDPDVEPEFPRACGFKFTATLAAETGGMYLDPVAAITPGTRLAASATVCNTCHPCPDRITTGCECPGFSASPRVYEQPLEVSGYCTPIWVHRTPIEMAPPPYWRDATTIVRVNGGDTGIRNLRIRGWANPAGLEPPTPEVDYFRCMDPCLDIEIACVPPRSELIIDGATRHAVVICEGVALNAYAYLSSAGGGIFDWPDVGCHGLMLVVDADAANTDPLASMSIDLVGRERG